MDAVKLVVVDLDDTLWRGVSAEVDPEQFPTSEGWPKGLWEALAFLKRRGVLLAIVSKNDEQRVRSFWDKIFRGQLKLEDFAVVQINWNPKPQNMVEVLSRVNLLPGNVVYIDDNPVERAAIKEVFPEMRVLGGSPISWRRILLWSPETQMPEITGESVKRTEMVRSQVVREEERKKYSREEFLAGLGVKMSMFEVNGPDDPRFFRTFELVNKTNQFNTTGKRWTHEECLKAFGAGTRFLAFEVTDRFTEYGLVGVLIVSGTLIEQFVMSCRVLGLEVELSAIAELCRALKEMNWPVISASFIETERNLPCRDLYQRSGFKKFDGGWQGDLIDLMPPRPKHVEASVRF